MTDTTDRIDSRNTHHPPHWFQDNTWYALTACTFNRVPIFQADEKKALWRDQLKTLTIELHLSLAAWVILDNHYHLLIEFDNASELPHILRRLHGSTANAVNKLDDTLGRRVWQNYWDTCIRNERGYWMRFNYIHHNPVKHGLTHCMSDYEFSSYAYYLRTRGGDWLADAFHRYPIKDYTDIFDDYAKKVG